LYLNDIQDSERRGKLFVLAAVCVLLSRSTALQKQPVVVIEPVFPGIPLPFGELETKNADDVLVGELSW
jgi:hypothetical protein